MKNFLNKIFGYIYYHGLQYHRQKQLKWYHKNAVIHSTVIIDRSGSIINSRAKDAVKIGERTMLRGNLTTFGHGGEIIIGKYSFVGQGSRIWSAKKISIGDRVLIAHDVEIHDNNSHPLESRERHIDHKHIFEKGFRKENDLREKEIIIEDDVWIGFNSVILKGVTIGKGAIIGANSIVRKDVPEFAIVAGVPAKIISYTT